MEIQRDNRLGLGQYIRIGPCLGVHNARDARKTLSDSQQNLD